MIRDFGVSLVASTDNHSQHKHTKNTAQTQTQHKQNTNKTQQTKTKSALIKRMIRQVRVSLVTPPTTSASLNCVYLKKTAYKPSLFSFHSDNNIDHHLKWTDYLANIFTS